jgi:hypothetical protein
MSDFFEADFTRRRLDVRVDDLLSGLEIQIDRSPVADDVAPGRSTTTITPKITEDCTKGCTGVCSQGTRAGTCTCPCLPGDMGLLDW